jgi:hypothetical protein
MLNMFILKKCTGRFVINTMRKTEMNNFFKIQFNKYNFAEAAKKEVGDKGKF